MSANLARRLDDAAREHSVRTGRWTSDQARLDQALAWVVTVVPALGSCTALALWWDDCAPGAAELITATILYIVTVIGLEVGFHRHLAHRAFRARPAVRAVLFACGSMAIHGPVIWWCAIHRRHHRLSDLDGDPHSPARSGGGTSGKLRGFFHSHMGWLFTRGSTRPDGWRERVQDLYKDELVLRIHLQYYVWIFVGLAIPVTVGAIAHGSCRGALLGLLWGGTVRLFLVNQCIWSLNSLCHMIGKATFRTHDESRNSFPLALFTFGQGWHNNHHAFPSSAYTGLTWWQIDFGGWVVHALKGFGLVWAVQRPTAKMIAHKQALLVSDSQSAMEEFS